jgi:hypothetical protein
MPETLGPLPSLGGKLPTLGGQSQGAGTGQPPVQSVQVQLQADSGLGQVLLNTLDQIVSHVLTQQPVDSQGNPTATTVYLQYQTGVGIDPRQYANVWTPISGSSLQSVLQSGQQAPQPAGPATPTTPNSGGSGGTPTVNTALQASLLAAWETSMLLDQMFLVDDQGQLQVYQSGSRSLAFAYGEIIKGMQPANPAQPSAQVQAAVQAAQKVLWQTDNQGNITGPTVVYQNYLTNQMAWAQAKSNLAAAQAEAMSDPALGQVWPQMAATYQTAVDQAYNTWISEGAQQVEQALATIESEGEDVVAAMVADARKLFDAWSLAGLSGVASQTQYSMVSPITWYDPTDDNIGFSKLTVTSESAARGSAQNTNSFAANWYKGQSSSTQASGSANFFGISLGAGGGGSSGSNSGAQGSSGQTTTVGSDQTSEVQITLEWLLCQAQRPWLVNDLFHVAGWYMVNQRKNSISDGTVKGQIDNQAQLLPMIPTSFLVVRNVTISASNWGEAGAALQAASSSAQGSSQASSSNFGGSVGFLGIGASAAHSEAQDSGQASAESSGELSFTWSGDAQQGTLTINGGQILGWIGAIVPASPPVDDPTLPSQTAGSSGSTSTSSSPGQQSATGTPAGAGTPGPSGQPPSGLPGLTTSPLSSAPLGFPAGPGAGAGSSGA